MDEFGGASMPWPQGSGSAKLLRVSRWERLSVSVIIA
jgi:hypothetical protein